MVPWLCGYAECTGRAGTKDRCQLGIRKWERDLPAATTSNFCVVEGGPLMM